MHSPQLDGIGSQHREAQGEESKKFKSYFDQIVILPGGYVVTNNDVVLCVDLLHMAIIIMLCCDKGYLEQI